MPRHKSRRLPIAHALLASLLAACSGVDPGDTRPGEFTLTVKPAGTLDKPRIEMASFSRAWNQLPDGQAFVDIGNGRPALINYRLIGSVPGTRTMYTQGDIVLGDESALAGSLPDASSAHQMEGVARISQGGRWPGGRVPYVIDRQLPNPQRVTDAIAHWQQHTALQFYPRTTETDYVLFKNGGGCSSWVGRVGGAQAVTLNIACTTGNAIHEIGHALGLWHEHSRTDRDQYIIIHFDNIAMGYEDNFEVISEPLVENGDVAGYNFGSIMHYPPDALAIDSNRPTIEVQPWISLLPGVVMGQRNGLSQGDVSAITLTYCEEPSYPCVVPIGR